jgi:hypothetical protein
VPVTSTQLLEPYKSLLYFTLILYCVNTFKPFAFILVLLTVSPILDQATLLSLTFLISQSVLIWLAIPLTITKALAEIVAR